MDVLKKCADHMAQSYMASHTEPLLDEAMDIIQAVLVRYGEGLTQ